MGERKKPVSGYRMDPEDKKEIQIQAQLARLSASDYVVRRCLNEPILSRTDWTNFDKLFQNGRDLARLGNLLKHVQQQGTSRELIEAAVAVRDAAHELSSLIQYLLKANKVLR